MRLSICWSTNGSAHHDCHKAHQALTGSYFVPVLVLDDGTVINKPDDIVNWAQAHAAR
jgi:hypothetical protein